MKLELKKFGDLLIPRPAGREAALVSRAYVLPDNETQTIELDFTGVAVMTPSWLEEFVTTLRDTGSQHIVFLESDNPTVKESIQALSNE